MVRAISYNIIFATFFKSMSEACDPQRLFIDRHKKPTYKVDSPKVVVGAGKNCSVRYKLHNTLKGHESTDL